MITDNFTINRYIIIASRSFLFFSYSLLLSSNISNESSQLNPTTHSFPHFIFNHFAIKSINPQNSIVPFLRSFFETSTTRIISPKICRSLLFHITAKSRESRRKWRTWEMFFLVALTNAIYINLVFLPPISSRVSRTLIAG